LYAGTGAIGIEALSRGSAQVTFVESRAASLTLLKQNVSDCQMGSHVIIQARTVQQFLSRPELWTAPYDIVFADPPYDATYELDGIFQTIPLALATPDAWLVVEHASKMVLPPQLGPSSFTRRYLYGDTALSIFSFPDEVPA
jgi:16S rRNA (guanine966-N2)-methyltransferase